MKHEPTKHKIRREERQIT